MLSKCRLISSKTYFTLEQEFNRGAEDAMTKKCVLVSFPFPHFSIFPVPVCLHAKIDSFLAVIVLHCIPQNVQ